MDCIKIRNLVVLLKLTREDYSFATFSLFNQSNAWYKTNYARQRKLKNYVGIIQNIEEEQGLLLIILRR